MTCAIPQIIHTYTCCKCAVIYNIKLKDYENTLNYCIGIQIYHLVQSFDVYSHEKVWCKLFQKLNYMPTFTVN